MKRTVLNGIAGPMDLLAVLAPHLLWLIPAVLVLIVLIVVLVRWDRKKVAAARREVEEQERGKTRL